MKEPLLATEVLIPWMVVGSGALYGLLKTMIEMDNWWLDRPREKLEIEKLRLDIEREINPQGNVVRKSGICHPRKLD